MATLHAEFSAYDPVSIWIANDADQDKATKVINDILSPSSGKRTIAGKKDRSPGILFGIGIFVGICIGIMIMGLIRDKREEDARKQTSWDLNGDGRIDRWREYLTDSITVDAIDYNSDGKPDHWFYYKAHDIIADESDCDYDGRKDCWGSYMNNCIVERKWSFLNDTIIDKRVLYKNNRKTEEFIDENRDGKFDYKIILDNFERVVKKVRIE